MCIRDSKKTLSSVRERFDVERVNAEEKIQKVEAITQTEIVSLKKTISQLREELEQVGIEQEEKIQNAVSGSQIEIGQLKTIIASLRDRLDSAKNSAEEKAQKATVVKENEIRVISASTIYAESFVPPAARIRSLTDIDSVRGYSPGK